MKRLILLALIFTLCVFLARKFSTGSESAPAIPTAVTMVREWPGNVVTKKEIDSSFTDLVGEASSRLPKKTLRTKGESHFVPAFVLEVAPALAKVQERMKSDHTAREAGIRFYSDCALADDVVTSVRALCLHLYRAWNGAGIPSVPANVAGTAKALEGMEP